MQTKIIKDIIDKAKRCNNQVFFFGAFDRNNYGDVLFPVLLTRLFKRISPDIVIHYIAFRKKDMTEVNGLKINNIRFMNKKLKNESEIPIVIVGGEILFSRWHRVISYIMPRMIGKMIHYIGILSNGFLTEWILSVIYVGSYWRFPFIPKIKHNNKIIFYNAVGGVGYRFLNNKDLHYLKRASNNVAYISVRDKLTFENCNKNFLNPNDLLPDSAVIWKRINNIGNINRTKTNKVIVFQCSMMWGKKNIKGIIIELNRILNTSDFSIVLQPIGYANLHDDKKILLKIYKEIKNCDRIIMSNATTLNEITKVLYSADYFIGTSLHGNLVSFTNGSVIFPIVDKIPKLKSFCDTWGIDKVYQIESIEKLSETILNFNLEHYLGINKVRDNLLNSYYLY